MKKPNFKEIEQIILKSIRSKVNFILEKMHLDKDKKETVFILFGVIFVIAFLYFFIFIFPPFSNAIQLLKETRIVRSELDTLESDLARIDVLNKRIDSMREQVDLYEEKLPSEYEIPLLLEELSAKAKDTYVKIIGISPVTIVQTSKDKGQAQEKSYEKIPIQISAESGYHQLGSFLNKMETGDRFINITEMQVSSGNKNPRIQNVELTLNTYVLLEK